MNKNFCNHTSIECFFRFMLMICTKYSVSFLTLVGHTGYLFQLTDQVVRSGLILLSEELNNPCTQIKEIQLNIQTLNK